MLLIKTYCFFDIHVAFIVIVTKAPWQLYFCFGWKIPRGDSDNTKAAKCSTVGMKKELGKCPVPNQHFSSFNSLQCHFQQSMCDF